jgi:two-component system, OmpR family, response regulator MprA
MARILVIDDNPLVRTLLALELGEAGHEVHVASGGAEGVASAAATPPDAVVLDLQMPGMEGRQVLLALKGLYPDLLVFLFTVYGDIPHRAAVPEADGCFVKSGDLAPLFAAIHGALVCPTEEIVV